MNLSRPPPTTSPSLRGTRAIARFHGGDRGFRERAALACAGWRDRLSRLSLVRRLALGGAIAAAVAGLGLADACASLWRLAARFPEAPFPQTSRLYGQPVELAAGEAASTVELMAELTREGYVPASAVAYDLEAATLPLRRGTWRQDGDSLAVQLRSFPTADGPAGGRRLTVQVQGGRIARLTLGGRRFAKTTLEPPLLASFYGPDVTERRPVSVAELPRQVVQAVLAAEDDGFFTHPGVSPRGIARALWVDLRDRDLHQGGSTITQQLVKHGARRAQPLEAALISLDPRSGAILAYVGGRDYRRSQFDRVAQAHRQLGSAFKPVVFAAAFEARIASPATLLDDSPIEVRTGNTVWSPQNYDRRYRGWITAPAAWLGHCTD
jgi:hypothetical protein